MSVVIGMFDEINAIEGMIRPLFSNYDVESDGIEVIVKKSSMGNVQKRTNNYSSLFHTYDDDLIDHLKDRGVPEKDAMFFSQGVMNGKELILVDVDAAHREEVAQYLRDRGMSPGQDTAAGMAMPAKTKVSSANTSSATTTTRDETMRTDSREGRVTGVQAEQHIDVIEEELKVGKRVVESGGVRLEKVVNERPVREEVTLRSEHVTVNRTPVDRAATSTELRDGFEEMSVELKEHAEELVVEKQARVVEEVTLNKHIHENVETVEAILRNVDVRITDIDSHTDTNLRYDMFRGDYENHFNTFYGAKNSNSRFDDYERAYRMGHAYAMRPELKSKSYNDAENYMRTRWTEDNPGEESAWENFKDAVEHAWNSVRSKFS